MTQEAIEESLQTIYDIATDNLGSLCLSNGFRSLQVPLSVNRYEAARQKADLASTVLQEVGVNRHGGEWVKGNSVWSPSVGEQPQWMEDEEKKGTQDK